MPNQRRQRTTISREELNEWFQEMGPTLSRDLGQDVAILAMLSNWCRGCGDNHPVAPLLERLLIALCDENEDKVNAYVSYAKRFGEDLHASLKELFSPHIPATDLDEILREHNIDLSTWNKPHKNDE
ncbi:MAG: hypothetical protein F4Z16_06820 [Rhodothermaceae bacterium]|nr:hypothetical protein [Rhodothermaceae bacterium]MYD66801.1 hypothetical protein [Rhodothermaceae bacterium]MYJ08383.1 hypothetical protein [Rhodothermaceae bacterium]